jgi:hypothetical protein
MCAWGYVYRTTGALSTCPARRRLVEFRFVAPDPDDSFADPLDTARAALARIFLWVGVGGLAVFAGTRDWRALGLAGAVWTLWTALRGLLDTVVSPVATILGNLLAGGSVGVDSAATVTIEEETLMLERHLEQQRPARRQILAGIRLAEIYRTHQRDSSKADALIAGLCTQYPDAPELRFVRRP